MRSVPNATVTGLKHDMLCFKDQMDVHLGGGKATDTYLGTTP